MLEFKDKDGNVRFRAGGCGGCLLVGFAILLVLIALSWIAPA